MTQHINEFEKWYKNSTNLLANGAPVYHSLKDAWQAAKADSESILQEQQNTIAELETDKTYWRCEAVKWAGELTPLQANINVLREALEDIATDAGGCCDSGYSAGFVARKALASTPAQSLIQHDDEVIERCAVIADDYIGCECLARDIRKLKGK